MMPNRFSRSNADNQSRVDKAFAAYSGHDDGTRPAGADPEKIEDESYAEIQELISQMEKIVVRLRELHQQPAEQQSHAEGGEPEEAGMPATGSPSAQGQP